MTAAIHIKEQMKARGSSAAEKKQVRIASGKKARSCGARRLTCKDETSLIANYLSSNLTARTLIAFEDHLKKCRDCQAFLQTYKKTIELTRSFLELDWTKQSRRRLMGAARKTQRGTH